MVNPILGTVIGLCLVQVLHGLIHHLHISKDDRDIFKIETFGFLESGIMNITVNHLFLSSKLTGKHLSILNDASESAERDPSGQLPKHEVGFILRKAVSESAAQQDLEKIVANNICILRALNPDDVLIDLSIKPGGATWKHFHLEHVVEPGAAGLYSLIFAHCEILPVKLDGSAAKMNLTAGTEIMAPESVYVSFKLDVLFVNPGPNYLSAGSVSY